MGNTRLTERKLFITLHGKLEPSPATALHSLFPLVCQRMQDEALLHHSPHWWKIWETQDHLLLNNYYVRNLPHIQNILWQLIQLFSDFFLFSTQSYPGLRHFFIV